MPNSSIALLSTAAPTVSPALGWLQQLFDQKPGHSIFDSDLR